MQDSRMAVVGIGATGTVLAAVLLSKYPDTFLIGRKPNLGEKLRLNGIRVSGEIADACFQEALAVAKSMGYDLGEKYLQDALGYLQKVGIHKDSMCNDIANKTPTEIDFLGAKVVAYARANGIATPFYVAMTNLVKSVENNYLDHCADG